MRTQSKWFRFGWPEMVVLPIAAIIVCGVCIIWIIGVLSLAGYAHHRFDIAMFDGAIKAEVIVIVPLWLFLRAADIGARVLSWLFRFSFRAAGSAGLRPPSQSHAVADTP